MSALARRLRQTGGRSALPKSLQWLSAVNWAQRTPAALPFSMPGMDEDIDGAIQQAAHPARHSMIVTLPKKHLKHRGTEFTEDKLQIQQQIRPIKTVCPEW